MNKSFKITLLVHIDALRHDYVTDNDMPFLYKMGQKGVHTNLIPPFGYEPDAAYLSGTTPEEYQGGTHFIFDEVGNGIPYCHFFPGFLDYLSKYLQYPFRLLLQRMIAKKSKSKRIRSNPFIAQIPFKLMKWFSYSNTKYVYEKGFVPLRKTVFDYLRENEMKFFYHSPPEFTSDAAAVRSRVLKKKIWNAKFAFLFIADLDDCGHRFGPNSPERHNVSKYVDKTIKDIYVYLKRFYDQIDIIAFGDHGMVNIRKTIDFIPLLKKLPLKIGKDYVYFLDSTLARFWHFNKDAEKNIVEALSSFDCGKIINKDEINRYNIGNNNRKLGDIIYWVDSGKMIFPNFWHRRIPKKGMHGYRDEARNNHAAFIFNSPEHKIHLEKKQDIKMADIFHITMNSLGININD